MRKYLRPALIAGLALLPALYILWIIATTGADNPSNDYLRSIGLFDQILTGGYDWGSYFRDSLQNQIHSYAFLFLVRLGIIKLTHWSVLAEIYLGFGLAVVKLALLYQLLTLKLDTRLKPWLLPVLSALVFSTSQISTFTFGETAMQQGLVQVGILAGVSAVVLAPNSWTRAAGMVLGGAIAAWSGGPGLVAWPLFLLSLIILGARRPGLYLAWLAGAALALWPYIAYGSLGQPGGMAGLLAIERTPFALSAIGLPFANQTAAGLAQSSQAVRAGLVGLLLLLWGVYLARSSAELAARRAELVPCVLLIAWGLLSALQTVASRRLLAPWYTTSMMPFWIGLAGLAFRQGAAYFPSLDGLSRPKWPQRLLSGLYAPSVFILLIALYASSNLTYRDKSLYLASRAPASAACLRNYRTAPTYCEGLVFQWGIGHPSYLADLARPLEKHGLSVFGPRQTLTLQGDFVLDRVKLSETPGIPGAKWVVGRQAELAVWSDSRHLDLRLAASDQVSWTISLPQETQEAVFYSAVKAWGGGEYAKAGAYRAEVYLQTGSGAKQLLSAIPVRDGKAGWQAIKIPLHEYRGEVITLFLAVSSAESSPGGQILYRYPHIDLHLDTAPPAPAEEDYTPANTELGNLELLAAPDYSLSTAAEELWQAVNLRPVTDEPGSWIAGDDPHLVLGQELDLCLRDYALFTLRISATPDLQPHAVQIYYRLDGQEDFDGLHSFWIPLLEGDEVHTYTYDLKLLHTLLPQNTRLNGLRIDPGVTGNGTSLVRLEAVGFFQGPTTGFCD